MPALRRWSVRVSLENALAIAAALLTVLFVGYWINLERSFQDSRQTALAAGKVRALQIVSSSRTDLEGTLRAIDFILRGTISAHLDELVDFPTAVQRYLALLPAQAGVTLTLHDLNGTPVISTAPRGEIQGQPPPAVADAAAGGGMVIGAAWRDPLSGEWQLPFTRAVARGEQPAGYMVASVPLRFFADKVSQIGLEDSDAADMVLLPQGRILASAPGRSDRVNQDAAREVMAHIAGGPAEGLLPAAENPDAHGPIVAWARLAGFPVVLVVSLSNGSVLQSLEANIARERRMALVNALLLLALASAVAVLVLKAGRQRRALERQEALYHGLFDQNHSIKLLSDPATGRIVAANKAACDFYGYSRDQLLAMKISEINCLTPDDIRRHMAEAMADKVPFFLFPHRLASGEVRQVEVYSGPVKLDGRTVLYSLIHDVSDRFALAEKLKASEALYRTIFETVPAGMILLDAQRNIIACNTTATRILGTDEAGLFSRRTSIFEPSGHPVADARRPTARALHADLRDELYFSRDAYGGKVWFTANSHRLGSGGDGAPGGAIVILSDISRLMRQEERLRISQLVFDSTTEGIMVTDERGVIIAVNRAFTDVTGYAADEVVGLRPTVLASGHHDKAFYQAMFESLRSKHSWEGEITNRHKNGDVFVERLVVNAVLAADGVISGYVAVLSDITARKAKEKHLWHQANFDHLTGLPNRTLFLDRAEQALAQSVRRQQKVGLLFVDLDRFKPVNDQYGHAVGDELLKAVAKRIIACVRAEDTVARIGGDEFVVLLPVAADMESGAMVGGKILAALSEPFFIGGRRIGIGACVGVAVGPMEPPTAAALLKAADEAMYRAKAAGRGRVERAA